MAAWSFKAKGNVESHASGVVEGCIGIQGLMLTVIQLLISLIF
jgi:hypothetical protein